MKKTEWFPADVKPVNAGLYPVKPPRGSIKPCDTDYVLWRWWTGSQWLSGAWAVNAPDSRRLSKTKPASAQRVAWRGLTERA